MQININYQKKRFIWHQSIIIAFAGLVAASFLFHWIPIEIARYIAIIVLAAQFWFEVKIGQRLFFTSPPFLLSFIVIFFFCFLQGMYIYLPEIPKNISTNVTLLKSLKAVGSDAERYIASFSMILLIAHAVAIFFIKITPSNEQSKQVKRISYLPTIFSLSILILTAANLIYFYSQLEWYNKPFDFNLDEIQTTFAYKTFRSLSPPLQSFMLIYLIRQWRGKSKKSCALLIILIIISLSGMFAIHEGKIPIFIGLAASLYWLRLSDISIKRIIITTMILIIIGIGGIQLLWVFKTSKFSPNYHAHWDTSIYDHWGRNFESDASGHFHVDQRSLINSPLQIKKYLFNTEILQKVLIQKLIWRQTGSINCFKNVIQNHWDQPFLLSKQLFWLKGLVPRAIWPEKPSLSLGREYAYSYCETTAPRYTGHSGSITLLGQSIIHGGRLGVLLHGAILIIALGGIATLSRNPHNLSSASIAALLPWLIDFDQDFAMYIANASKFFLVMLPIIYVSSLSERKLSSLKDV